MNRVALVSSEPIRPRMAGIGIRYFEFARRLPEFDLETVLISPADRDEMPETGGDRRSLNDAPLARLVEDCDVVVCQGQLANDVVLLPTERPTVIDLYDPWLVEHFHYLETLGLDPYRNDHASWMLQLSRGDFFLCSSEEQRLFYLGLLTALGRVNPEVAREDPDFERLIASVPFGLPEEPIQPVEAPALLPPRQPGERRILFGGLYDWYDPWTLLDAMRELANSVRLFFVDSPNPTETPQRLLGEVESECRRRGWLGTRVVVLPWVESSRRFDLLSEVDVLSAPHRPSLETRLSLRTRFLDAVVAGCPVVVTEDGAMSRWVREFDAGWVVPHGEVEPLAGALRRALDRPEETERKLSGAARLAKRFAWSRVLEPLADYCRQPTIDETKRDFASPRETRAPADSLMFRVRRRLKLLGRP